MGRLLLAAALQPLPLAAVRVGEPGGGRQPGLSVFDGDFLVAEECIKYNPANDEFYAECRNPAHGKRCRSTRSAHEGRKRAQGRPLGFLAAWVLQAMDFPTAQAHQRNCKPSQADRSRARHALDKVGQQPLLHEFQGKERPPRAGKSSEPENVP